MQPCCFFSLLKTQDSGADELDFLLDGWETIMPQDVLGRAAVLKLICQCSCEYIITHNPNAILSQLQCPSLWALLLQQCLDGLGQFLGEPPTGLFQKFGNVTFEIAHYIVLLIFNLLSMVRMLGVIRAGWLTERSRINIHYRLILLMLLIVVMMLIPMLMSILMLIIIMMMSLLLLIARALILPIR